MLFYPIALEGGLYFLVGICFHLFASHCDYIKFYKSFLNGDAYVIRRIEQRV